MLKIDSFSIVKGVMYLLTRLYQRLKISSIKMKFKKGNEILILEITWDGEYIERDVIEKWGSQQFINDEIESFFNLKGIFETYDGKVITAENDVNMARGISFNLIVTSLDSRNTKINTIESRPISYEFDLFKQQDRDSQYDKMELDKLTFVVFDTETTGLSPSKGDEIISIGAIRIVNGKLLQNEVFEQLVNPERSIPIESIRIHGIKPEMLINQPSIKKVLFDFQKFVESAVLVCHNTAFDLRFLQLKEESTGICFKNPVLDTLLMSAVVHPHQESHNLNETAQRMGVNIIGRHTALGDAIITAEVFLKLLSLLRSTGLNTLEDVYRASSKTHYAMEKF